MPLRTVVVVWASPVMWVVVLVLNDMFLLHRGELALPRVEGGV